MSTSIFQFIQQARTEIRKVVWPTKKEVGVSTLMVLGLAFVLSIFFVVLDQLLSWFISVILSFNI